MGFFRLRLFEKLGDCVLNWRGMKRDFTMNQMVLVTVNADTQDVVQGDNLPVNQLCRFDVVPHIGVFPESAEGFLVDFRAVLVENMGIGRNELARKIELAVVAFERDKRSFRPIVTENRRVRRFAVIGGFLITIGAIMHRFGVVELHHDDGIANLVIPLAEKRIARFQHLGIQIVAGDNGHGGTTFAAVYQNFNQLRLCHMMNISVIHGFFPRKSVV